MTSATEQFRHLSVELAQDLDTALSEEVRRVDKGEVAAASVSLTFAVGRNEKTGETEITYSLKDGTTRKGSFAPSLFRQLRLPE